jgi:CelD/BcsL family acetyltransferase involved in cellulose biosynthesis
VSLRTRRVETLEGLAALGGAWSELTSQAGQSSPFLSHDWFACCWIAQPPARSPEILVVDDGSGPAGLVPLARWTERRHGWPVRCVGLLDCPDTPFADLVSAGDPRPVATALVDHLLARADWDLAVLGKIRSASPTFKALEEALTGRARWRCLDPLPSPCLAVTGDWDAFWRPKSQRFKKTVRNVQNRLERAGAVTVEEHRAVDTSGPIFRDVIELTARSWKAAPGLAIATMPRMPVFFAELTRRATARDWLSLWLLRVDGRALAMEYQLRDGGTVHALRADYDAASAELSPGSALSCAIARKLFERGDVREYDMGPGLNDYKLRWATGRHETVDVVVYRPGAYGRLVAAIETGVIPGARRVRDWLR